MLRLCEAWVAVRTQRFLNRIPGWLICCLALNFLHDSSPACWHLSVPVLGLCFCELRLRISLFWPFCLEKLCPYYLPSCSFFALGCWPACNAPCICMAVSMISLLSLSIFFFKIFLEPLCGAPNAPQIIFHEGGLFIGYEKNVVIKEALAFERPAFCDFP